MVEVYVGIGCNVDAKRNIALGVELLRQNTHDFKLSCLYEGPAIGVRGDDFVNAVAQFRWQRGLADLTELVANIHGQAGRSPTERAAEGRTLDLDLELFGQAVDGPNRLPRKDVLAYDFVLAPLAELSPELPHPLLGSTMAALWAPRAGSTLLRRLGDYVQH
jgi:2-amino-4-hydroxy-6-hydroxymethyldihydropteridine diphosphokinase